MRSPRAEYRKAKSEEWVAAGICANCGKRPRREGARSCTECRPKNRSKYKKEVAKRWIAEGKCPNCGARPPEPRRRQCRPCLDISLAASRRARVKNPDAFRNQYHALKAQGVCTACGVSGKPLVTSTACADCRRTERHRAVRTKYALMLKYGGACFCCGETRVAFLTMDHTNDDGASKRNTGESGSGGRWYQNLLKQPVDPTLRVACYNCNCARRVTGVCPHVDNSYFEQALAREPYDRV